MGWRRLLQWSLTSAPDFPLRRDAFLIILTLAGLAGGGIDFLLEEVLHSASQGDDNLLQSLLGFHLWTGAWFGLAIGVCLIVARRFWIRFVATLALAPLILGIAAILTPRSALESFFMMDLGCTRGASTEWLMEISADCRRRYVIFGARAVTAFVIILHLALEWRQRSNTTGCILALLLGASILIDVILKVSATMSLQYEVYSEDGHGLRVVESNFSGLAQALSVHLGLAAAETLGRVPRPKPMHRNRRVPKRRPQPTSLVS